MSSSREESTHARKIHHKKTPSEVWDDDFEFQQNDGIDEHAYDGNASPSRKRRSAAQKQRTRPSIDDTPYDTLMQSEPGPSRAPFRTRTPPPGRSSLDALRAWSESPTTPERRARQSGAEENWDDDFVDKFDSPVRIQRTRHPPRQAQASPGEDQENWDEDFDMAVEDNQDGFGGRNLAGASPSSKRSRNETSWDSSDEELGFARKGDDEEDRTVTAKSRRRPLGALNTDVPPVPPLPTYLPTIPSGDASDPFQMQPSPFPRSPTMSVFSIPTTTGSAGGHDSVQFGSTAHLALGLRRTHSTGSNKQVQNLSNRFPAVSPSRGQKERRRLRKKSRPPHLDGNIIELDDKSEHPATSTQRRSVEQQHVRRPITPDPRPSTPTRDHGPSSSVTPSPMAVDPPISSSPPVSLSNKSPLLSRIGSVKRWSTGMRRKRASAGPSELSAPGALPAPAAAFSATALEAERFDNNRTPRAHQQSHHTHGHGHGQQPAPSPPSAARSSRFFRRESVGADKPPVASERRPLSSASGERREVFFGELSDGAKHPPPRENEARPPSRNFHMKTFGQRSINGDVGPPPDGLPEGISNADMDGDTKMRSPTQSVIVHERQTRIRPRLPHQAPSTLQVNTLLPRAVSGPAAHEYSSSSRVASSAVSSTRSVSTSTATMSTAFTSIRSASSTATVEDNMTDGSRSIMGSIRRVSLVGAHKRHRRSKSGGAEATTNPLELLPPVPVLMPDSTLSPISGSSDSEPRTSLLLPAAEISPVQSSPGTTRIKISPTNRPEPVPMDLASPVELADPTAILPSIDLKPGRVRSPDGEREPTLSHSKSSSFATPPPGERKSPGRTSSPQAASLSRAYQYSPGGSSNIHRRNSLGDLKIPSRISRAQDGLKKDLTRVREFASHVEQMKDLRNEYFGFVNKIQENLEANPPSRVNTPSLFSLSRPRSRARSNTNPLPPKPDTRQLSNAFRTIDSKYRVAWECADLLIDLGTGTTSDTMETGSRSAPSSGRHGVSRGRERAITLAGDEGKPNLDEIIPVTTPMHSSPPPLLQWRASTGRHDTNQRQLILLREMLSNAESAKDGSKLDLPESTNLHWRLDEGMESNITLPTEDSNSAHDFSPKKRSSSRLRMVGIRDMLRALKRHHSRHARQEAAQSSTTLNTESSHYSSSLGPGNLPVTNGIPQTMGRRRAKTSSGAEAVPPLPQTNLNHPYLTSNSVTHKSSPRRPSLASLFRIGQRHQQKNTSASSNSDADKDQTGRKEDALASGRSASATSTKEDYEFDESDWDRMDSTSDVDVMMTDRSPVEGQGDTLKRSQRRREALNAITSSMGDGSRGSKAFETSSFTDPGGSSQASSQTHLRSRLSNVDEREVSDGVLSGRRTHVSIDPPATARPSRPQSRGGIADRTSLFASVRSVPPPVSAKISKSASKANGSAVSVSAEPSSTDPTSNLKLAMTPENIRPLLENARAVTARLKTCIAEVRVLVENAEIDVIKADSLVKT